MRNLFILISAIAVITLVFPLANAESVPDWVKNTAGWWADDTISETEFVNAIEFLVNDGIIQVSASQSSENSQGVPKWVKNTAGWWADDTISETEFVNAISYLIKIGIIVIESNENQKLFAEMWINGQITDNEFLSHIDHKSKISYTDFSEYSSIRTSQLPDWILNNAGWWAARILTDSDFSNFNHEYETQVIYPCPEFAGTIKFAKDSCLEHKHNSYGFRGIEFEKEKPNDMYRIFVVGGSTTYGRGAIDSETWPAYLQQIINNKIIDQNIEVINAGASGATSVIENKLLKEKLINFDPDLVIFYDGWNDYKILDPEHEGFVKISDTIQSWKSMCQFGIQNNFDVIIIVQPVPGTAGQRVLTQQELFSSLEILTYKDESQQYVNAFSELDKTCSKTEDFRRIFDYVSEPIFYDNDHTMATGNKIIAENVFATIAPYFGKSFSVDQSKQNSEFKSGTGVVYAVGSDLSGMNFDNLNLQNAVFDRANLNSASFKNANLDGARFPYADLSNTNLSNNNLENSILTVSNLSNSNLSNTILTGADLKYSDLTGIDFSNVELNDVDLTGANLSGADLSNKVLTKTVLKEINLSFSNLSGVNLAGLNLMYADLSGVDLSNRDLTEINISHTNLSDTDLSHSNLYHANIISVDLTKIKNKSLANTDLTLTSFSDSNLSDVNMDNVILQSVNFSYSNLSNVDFTSAIDNSLEEHSTPMYFPHANLSNTNFEGMDFFQGHIYSTTFKDKASLPSDQYRNLFEDKAKGFVFIISATSEQNNLILEYLYFTVFDFANLENTNLKNTDLQVASFVSSNLTNANLSGADLSNAYLSDANLSDANLSDANLQYAYLSGADLSGADLSGANLSDANLSDADLSETILKCINHPICD